jgi:hypothetical protein
MHLQGIKLQVKVSDLKQELSQLRKSNHNLQLKSKRLGSNYGTLYIADFIYHQLTLYIIETLQLTHEALLKEHDTLLVSHKQQFKVLFHIRNDDLD